ncbi:UDP-N-acetylmuramoyl-L-alanyl-D-glutamate--2,6-diaminopimelate ligase [Ileibacterium valens]|uniref:UDP-N-acetylmuramyl-tripeptide synthetase n=2 Tax=Ileibacterium valens TaxID=1862668 RepID=A0A1U7NDR1_9FIRM|nr:UDP-N-acetylmuramoyl-L-alanyl-D-glutamate--2,6-diaminopimelate ligase [Ileibacterium valens]OLU37476.1 UDP-N-acetylmuramyl peptide synthase [Ileibacterium valens]OLU39266.1 UDP-N-acetylmuramyl peptide synthase [Erysipelotrichaceae bacterium NYU-BL-E8]OLU42303.1 UDP-N-acetylmuramyl peptide synthase [Erysipelotrichaceae bacterium NYU-BL-F16]
MRLSKMFKNAPTVNISGLCFDSRKIKPGDMYFCLPGLTFDGHDFIDQAVDSGALAVVHSREIPEKKEGAIYIKVDDVNEAMNQVARIFYCRPSDKMKMFGVTGTNGKSTITNIIRHFQEPETPCGYIGTIAISYGNTNLAPSLTTPDTLLLQKTLKDMVDGGMKACALEVSSHGLALGRVDGVDFDAAVFTNLTYDHLDFHGTMENYFEAKSKLFKERVRSEGVSILNKDDETFNQLSSASKARVISYSIKQEADYRATNIKLLEDHMEFDLSVKGKKYRVVSNLLGEFNIYNLLAAFAACAETGSDIEELIEKAKAIPQIAGRLEQIKEGQDFNIIVDFAHTPDGIEKIMEFGQSIASENGRLIAVFGSAGKRDKAKRPVFGEIADKYCSNIFLTEDDPRDEDPKEIAEEIKKGIHKATTVFIEDRYEAIRQAIETAKKGDTVLILGKGDEPFMYHEEGRVPWKGDNTVAKECVLRLLEEKKLGPSPTRKLI